MKVSKPPGVEWRLCFLSEEGRWGTPPGFAEILWAGHVWHIPLPSLGTRRSSLQAHLCWIHPHHSPQRVSQTQASQPPPKGAKASRKPCSLWGGPRATLPTATDCLRAALGPSPSAGSRTHLPACPSCSCTWKRVGLLPAGRACRGELMLTLYLVWVRHCALEPSPAGDGTPPQPPRLQLYNQDSWYWPVSRWLTHLLAVPPSSPELVNILYLWICLFWAWIHQWNHTMCGLLSVAPFT